MPVVIVMMAASLLTGLATTVVLGTMTETAIAGNYGEAAGTLYAAEAAAEFALAELTAPANWDEALSGTALSTFVDGPAAGLRSAGATAIDLARETADINALPGARAAAATYRLYAYGRFADLVAGELGTERVYVVVWVADLTDAVAQVPGDSVLGVIGRAYGSSGSRRAVAVTATRGETAPAALRVISWAELR